MRVMNGAADGRGAFVMQVSGRPDECVLYLALCLAMHEGRARRRDLLAVCPCDRGDAEALVDRVTRCAVDRGLLRRSWTGRSWTPTSATADAEQMLGTHLAGGRRWTRGRRRRCGAGSRTCR